MRYRKTEALALVERQAVARYLVVDGTDYREEAEERSPPAERRILRD